MTPLAAKVARELTLPKANRTFDDEAGVLDLFDQDMHCFEVSAIAKTVNEAMDEDNLWPDIETMLPGAFLPSPLTWLEYSHLGQRSACVLKESGDRLWIALVMDRGPEPSFSLPLAKFRARGPFEQGERIDIQQFAQEPPPFRLPQADDRGPESQTEVDTGKLLRSLSRRPIIERYGAARTLLDLARGQMSENQKQLDAVQAKLGVLETDGMVKRFIGMSVLMLDLINTPGLVGLRQHDPHRALAKQLSRLGVGSFPLRSWSEVVVKTHTAVAGDAQESGATFRKCLHFVRSHKRHYQDGHVTVIPAHWRGDPALGIKRTRYRVAA